MNPNNQKMNIKRRISWTTDKISLLRKYKEEGLSLKEIASLMDSTASAISCACTNFKIHLDGELRKKRLSEAALKGIKSKIKKYNLTETTPHLLSKIKELKAENLANNEIAKKLSISFSTVANICHKNKIILDEDARKKRQMESGIKGGAAFKKKRQNLAKIHSFNEDLGYIIGVCFGDGSVVDFGCKGCLELRTIDESFAKAFYNALLNYTTQKPCYYTYTYNKSFKKENRHYKNVKYHEVFFNNVFFARNILNMFGSTSNWRIGVDKFLSYRKEFWTGFIRGMFDSEGSFWIDYENSVPSGNISFSSVNREGALTFHELLNKLGYDFNLNSTKKKNGTVEFKIRSCKLSLIKKFFYEIGFTIDRKQRKLANFIELRNL